MSDLILSRPLHAHGPAETHGLAPGDVVALLRRNWALLGVCALAFAIATYFGTSQLLPKQYAATGMVAIDTRSLAIPALEGAVKGGHSGHSERNTPTTLPMIWTWSA